jgi:hypothetical protein
MLVAQGTSEYTSGVSSRISNRRLQTTWFSLMWSDVQQKCCVVLYHVEYPVGKKGIRLGKCESAMTEKVDRSFGCCILLIECVE